MLGIEPTLHVPGMTEFTIRQGIKIGLMPYVGIKKIIGDSIPATLPNSIIPSSEIYLLVDNPHLYLERAISAGFNLCSELMERDWNHRAGYVMDFDGHVIAFAEKC